MLKDPADLERFARNAQPGAWETYGRGERPPSDMVRAMRPLVDAGVLVPTCKREGGGLLYLVKRGAGTMPPRVHARPRTPRNWRQQSKVDLARVHQCLVLAARRGAPCPSYRELAQRLGLSWRGARHRVEQLIRTEQIRSVYDQATGWRVVTILTGRNAGCSTMAQPKGGTE